MPYSGGKQAIAQRIVDLFPEHEHYVEPFAGALSVLLTKPQSTVETVNDIDSNLVTFWRVLREQPDELARACALTPHARQEHTASRDTTGCDDVERARRVWVQLTQSRGARLSGNSGWRFVHSRNAMSLPRYLTGYLARISPAAQRLRNVSIECRDAIDVIRTYARPGALLYIDPPYLGETRYGKQYAHEFDDPAQHASLLDVLTRTDAAVVLSGYASDLYRDTLTGWKEHRIAANAMTGEPRTEVLWTNFTAPGLLDLEGA